MLFNPLLRRFWMAAAAFLFVFPVFSQSKKGFKKLDKGKWEAAASAFALDTSNSELRPVALFGIAQALAAPENSNKDYRQAMQLQEKARTEWKSLKNSQRAELTKKFKVTSGAIDKLRSTAATSAWKSVEKTTSLPEVDDFLEVFPTSPTHIKAKANKKQAALLDSTVRNAKSYADLSYLLNRHHDDIGVKYPGKIEDLEQRNFEAFLTEKNVDQLEVFFRENPSHPVSGDAARNEFRAVWKSESLPPYLTFLAAQPESSFVPYIRKKAVNLLKNKSLGESEKANLGEAEKGWLAELQWEASGKSANTTAPFDPAEHELWAAYIRRAAPAPGAFRAVEKMYRYYAGRGDWTTAAALLKENKPRFQNRQRWFDSMLAIADGPEYGLKATNIGAPVSTDATEITPVLSSDGKELYFCGHHRPDNFSGEDIFVTRKTETGWSAPELVKDLSLSGHQAPSALTADGNRMLLYHNAKQVQSDRTATGWSTPVPVPVDLSQFPWVGMCQIAANNQVMVIEAKKVVGGLSHSGADIYIALRAADGNWGKPMKLDSVINTDKAEMTPFLHPDMRTMYFSSAGHPGLGGMDVFKTTRLDDTWLRWSEPLNLGREVNTPSDNWGYIISTDGTVAWFATRVDDDKNQDLFWIPLPDSMRPEAVKTYTLEIKNESGEVFDGDVLLIDPATDAVAGIFKANPTGGPTTITAPNDKPYMVRLKKDGYFPTTMPIPVELPGKPLEISAALRPVSLEKMLKTGETAILNLLFDFDKDELRPESLAELKTVADIALKNNYRINLLGYTDNKGEPSYNKVLSQKRADAAKEALVGLKVPAERIGANGFGEDKPVADNETEEGRAKNRRVEIQFLKE